jgi:citronellol/citronellal dehydrogenase
LSREVLAPDLLSGKVCVISGSGTGLGRAAAMEMARLGATVVGCGRRREPIEATATQIRENGGAAEAAPVDIRDNVAVDRFFDDVLDRHGRVDVLINNAGGQFAAPAETITAKGYRNVIELNVLGTWHMTHAAATKAMIPQNSGRILNVTVSPHYGFPLMVHTGAARGAVESMTRTLSIEWARFGITICALAAGTMATETSVAKYPAALLEAARLGQPLPRFGKEEEWASFVAYMACDAASYFTGCVLTMDGGRDNYSSTFPPASYVEGGQVLAERRRQRRGS